MQKISTVVFNPYTRKRAASLGITRREKEDHLSHEQEQGNRGVGSGFEKRIRKKRINQSVSFVDREMNRSIVKGNSMLKVQNKISHSLRNKYFASFGNPSLFPTHGSINFYIAESPRRKESKDIIPHKSKGGLLDVFSSLSSKQKAIDLLQK